MKEEKSILDKIGRRDGMTTPEGYFDDFASRLMRELPARPELENPEPVTAPKSLWQRVRPYTYMAAMFAGVWCMLKLFTTLTGTPHELSIENIPGLANAVSNEQFVEDYIIDDVSGYDLYDRMVADSIDFYNPEDTLFMDDYDMWEAGEQTLPQ